MPLLLGYDVQCTDSVTHKGQRYSKGDGEIPPSHHSMLPLVQEQEGVQSNVHLKVTGWVYSVLYATVYVCYELAS